MRKDIIIIDPHFTLASEEALEKLDNRMNINFLVKGVSSTYRNENTKDDVLTIEIWQETNIDKYLEKLPREKQTIVLFDKNNTTVKKEDLGRLRYKADVEIEIPDSLTSPYVVNTIIFSDAMGKVMTDAKGQLAILKKN